MKFKSRNVLILAAVLALVFGIYKLFTKNKDDRAYLLSLPAYVAELGEKRQAPEIRRLISPDYKDEKGRTFQDLNTLITALTVQAGEISIYTLNPNVEVDTTQTPPVATLNFKAALVRGPKQASVFDIVPQTASIYEFTLYFTKTDEGWLVKSGTWEYTSLN